MKKKQTVKMIGLDSDQYEQRLIDGKKDFTLRFSNYTTIIETDNSKYLFSNANDKNEGFAFFNGFRKIKKDIENAPHIDNVNERDLIYFDSSDKLPDRLKLRNAYNVDIKSAYIRCAYLHGFISKETFEYCMKLKKSDRLKSFGMLATNYTCFDYKAGELVDCYTKKDAEKRKYFFAVVQGISEVMQKIKSDLENDFLFYWVDGIYFKTEKSAKAAIQLFKDAGYDVSFDKLTNFALHSDDFRHIIEFGKKKEKKIFTVPKLEYNLKARIKKTNLIKKHNSK